MRALIDCDILRYQIGSIELDNPYSFGGTMPAPIKEVKRIVDETIQHIVNAVQAHDYVLVLSGKGNFRNEIAKQEPYKGNRVDFVKPYNWKTVGDHIIEAYPDKVMIIDGYEADDWLAIEQRKYPEDTVICSRDKDLATCHGWHYRWACGEKQPEIHKHWISEYEAKKFFFKQMLTGDNTDNIMGCGKRIQMMWGGKSVRRRKGIGDVKARQLLADCKTVEDMFEMVKMQYQHTFIDEWEDVMLENARLLFIGQTPDNLFDWSWLDLNLKEEEIINEEAVCSEGICEQPTSPDQSGQDFPDCSDPERAEE